MTSLSRKPTRRHGIDHDLTGFTEADFLCISELAYRHTGISLSDHKRYLVYGRLRKRLQALGLRQFRDYCDLLKCENNDEVEHFVNAITTNLTYFFREGHHFDYIRDHLVSALLESGGMKHPIRILSAGCSTGEEPYSIAITLLEAIDNLANHDLQILATDLDSNALATASAGIYSLKSVDGIDEQRLRRWFLRGKGAQQGNVRVSPVLRNMVTFKQLNLLKDWPMKELYDIVFCRNVVIYFDKPTQQALYERLARHMRPGSHLFIGHSEQLKESAAEFRLIGKSIYQKVG